MGFLFVVVAAPLVDLKASLVQCSEPVHIQAVFSELTVVRFDKRILSRLAGLNELQLDATFLRPEEHRLARKLRTVVANDGLRQPAQRIHEARDPCA